VKGAIISSMSTFFSIIISHFLYKNDRLSIIKVLGCLIGFIGVVIVNINTNLLDLNLSFKGEGFALISAFVASAAAIYGKKITQTLDSMVVTGYQLTIGGGVLILIGCLNHGTVLEFNIKSTLLLLYLAILSAIAFLIWTVLLKYNKVGEITIFSFFIPVFGAILSAVFLNENILKLKNIFALIFVSLGVWMINVRQEKKLQD
jgi:drug/metabolite transporter (DMT)-like permease